MPDTHTYVPNDLASGGLCNHCQKCGAPRDEHANTRGAVAYPESGDYPVGGFEVSARRDDNDVPEVLVSGVRFNTTLFGVSPAEARALATALRVAADQAGADAGTDATADDTPDWLRKLDVGAVPQRLVFGTEAADADSKVVQAREAWLRHCHEEKARQRTYTRAGNYLVQMGATANRETVGAEESTDECEYQAAGGRCNHVISCDGPQSIGAEETDVAHEAPGYDAPGYPRDPAPWQ